MFNKDTPITYGDSVFSVKGQETASPPPMQPRRLVPPPNTESDTMETDDDLVNDVVRAVIHADTDEVVYPRSVRLLPLSEVSIINASPLEISVHHLQLSSRAICLRSSPSLSPRLTLAINLRARRILGFLNYLPPVYNLSIFLLRGSLPPFLLRMCNLLLEGVRTLSHLWSPLTLMSGLEPSR